MTMPTLVSRAGCVCLGLTRWLCACLHESDSCLPLIHPCHVEIMLQSLDCCFAARPDSSLVCLSSVLDLFLSLTLSRPKNPEHLLIFAAGNAGDSVSTTCTIGSPAIGKNVLAVGSSSSGDARFTATNSDGDERVTVGQGYADIDTVSFFSSRGPTTDNRIKPDIVAPGDLVRGSGDILYMRENWL